MQNSNRWRSCATREILEARARLYAAVRAFFFERKVLEVDTPILSAGATVDPNIDSFRARDVAGTERWLQTSPEFAMKRLLAGGSGPIYQLAHVFRSGESGRHHNPEFVMLEWYRPAWDHQQLMDEVAALLAVLGVVGDCTRTSYRQAFLDHAGIDPLTADEALLRKRAADRLGRLPEPDADDAIARRDFYLDLLMSAVVAPRLGLDAPQFVYDFPASQAALARVREGDPPVAERFELFWSGIELANGFHELTDAAEQQRRFERDQARRRAAGREVPPCDAHLLQALQSGLPDCAGVALGLDRLLMLTCGLHSVGQSMAFDFERA
jgi:lysyl-tRNA synthetase class 2